MSATELIARLRDKGIRISARDGALELDAPSGALTEDLRSEILAYKPELLRLLSWSRRSGRATSIPLVPVSRDKPLQLSWSQQRLWFLDQLEPGNPAYNISWTVRLKGALDVSALRAALCDLLERHEALRTVFPAAAGEAYQLIRQAPEFELLTEDLSQASEEQLRARLAELAGGSFDLAAGPLLRPCLLRLSQAEHILLIVVHHIVADGASMRILFRELAACYEARREGDAPVLPELPIQYADYATWQRRWLDSQELERQGAYWQQHLAGLPPLLELPTDRSRAAAMRYRGASVLRVLPADLAVDLRRISREHGCTLFMTMLAAFYVLLMRYSGRKDLAVGTPLGGRSRTQLEGLIGFFINTVVLRADLSGDPSFADLLKRVRDVALQAHANQDMPFEKLVELIQPQRELSYSPVFQVMFDLQEEPRWKLPVRSLEVIPEVVFSSRTASFDLTLSVRQAEQGLDAMFEYDTDLFDESSIEAMAQRYQVLLEAIVANPEQSISALPLVDPQANKQQVRGWNSERKPYPDTCTLAELFEQQVAQNPAATALVDGARQFSYGELNSLANGIAHDLRAQGVGPDSPVALCARRSAEAFCAVLAIHKAGGCVVPMDPAYPRDRLAFMLEDSGAGWLLHHCDDTALAGGLADDKQSLRRIPLVLDAAGRDVRQSANPRPAAGAKNLAYLMYTSGTSGTPKGAELEHSGLVNYVTQLTALTGTTRHDRVLQFASLSFDIAIEESLLALLNGATLVLREAAMTHSLRDFVDGCERHAVSCLSLPTAWWHELCEALDHDDLKLPACLHTVIIGGEKAELPAFRKWQQHASRVRLFNTYGPTETSIVAAWAELTDLDPSGCGELPIGMPVPNVRVWVMDETLQPVPEGLPGEICIAGPGVARGYRNQPGLTAERFVPVTFPDGTTETLYRTGDRARYLKGQGLIFLGRNDAQLKVRGHRVEPGEVEAVLSALPGVGRSAVVLHGDGPSARLVAYVTGDARVEKLRGELVKRLPDYLMPASIVAMDALPFTANGKLDRAALPEPVADRIDSSVYVAPRDVVDQQLADIWSEVLGVDSPGIHDDFFQLGGHSLIATRVMARVRNQFRVNVPLRALFDHPTIAALAKIIDAHDEVAGLALTRRPRAAKLPPVSWPQQRLLMLEKLEPGNTAYNLYSVAKLTGELNIAALQDAISRVTRRHESLRTCFAEHAGEPVQVIQPAVEIVIQEHALTDASAAGIEQQLCALIDQPFDLQRGPLWRVHLLRDTPARDLPPQQYLLLVLHHIVADGWSVNVLLRELQTHYAAYCAQSTVELPDLPLQYADFAFWQRDVLAGGKLAEAERYWAEQLRDMPPLLSLPLDFERPEVQGYQGGWVTGRVDGALRGALGQLANRHSATLFMVLLTAFKALLLRHTGRTDIAVGTPVAGRTHTELEPLIGCFLNTLVLRTRCASNPDFASLLGQVRQATLAAYDHQLLPFEKLLELLKPPRSAAYTPLVQVMFNLHNEREQGADLPGLSGLPGLKMQPVMLGRAAAKFDLSASLTESGDGLIVGFEYNTALFAPATVEALMDDYLELLRAMAAEPERRVCAVPLHAERERVSSAVEPAGGFDASAAVTVAQRFREMVARYPDRPAVEQGDEQISYRELGARVQAVAASVRAEMTAIGCTSSARVGLYLGHDVSMLAGLMGVLEAGCAYVPMDRTAPAARCRQILQSADIDLVVTDEANRDRALSMVGDDAQVLVLNGAAAAALSDAAGGDLPQSDLAYVLFTSGSTGVPKGVMQTHENVLHHVATYSRSVGLTAEDKLSLIPAYGFDAAVMDIFGALLNGACLRPVDVTALPAATEVESMLRGLTVLHMTPTVFRYLFGERRAGRPLADARALVLGGEQACYGDFELFEQHFGPGAVFINGLGPSESTMALQFQARHGARLAGRQVPVGAPVPGCEVLLLNENGDEAGVEGELVIVSRNISPGYLNEPALSERKMRPDVASGRVRYFTGDRVRRLPDGDFVYTGRLDGQIKIRGHRIEPGDIEAALVEVPGVKRAAVAVIGDTLCAYFSGQAQIHELRRALQTRLPPALVPGRFICVEKWPLLPNGKIDRAALVECLPVVGENDGDKPVVPRTDCERELVNIWQSLLNAPAIGVYDDFFALGGHSLLAMRMLARIRERFGAAVSLREFFSGATVAQLAVLVEARIAAGSNDALPLLPRPIDAALPPLSWAQQRLWFLDRLEPENAAYNLHWAARLNGAPDVASLQLAIGDLQQRHESLRTAFGDHAGVPVQIIHADAAVKIRHEVLASADPARVRARLLDLVKQPFDLSRAPLLRVHLLELAPDETVLLFVMHHIISDGWSMGVLFRDLSALYAARVRGCDAELPTLPVQYADFAHWQQRWLSGAALEQQQRYWKAKLADAPPLLELPLDHQRPPVQRFRGAWVNRRYDRRLLEALRQLAEQESVTVFMVLLTVFKVLLMRHTGRTDIIVGAPVAGRNRPEVEGLIGFFLNTLVLRTGLNSDGAFREALAAVKQTTLDAYDHQDLPFEKLLELVQPPRSAAHSPLVQVTINLHNEPGGQLALDGLDANVMTLDRGTSKFDLALALIESERGLSAGIEYNTDLFEESTVSALLDQYGELLERFIADPSMPICAHPLDTSHSPAVISKPFDPMPQGVTNGTIGARFEQIVALYPERIAVRTHRGEEAHALTYIQLHQRANALANRLAGICAPQARVGLLLGHDENVLIAILATLKAGLVYVPLDRHSPPARLRAVADSAAISAIVCDEQNAVLLPDELSGSLPVQWLSSNESAAVGPDVRVNSDDLAYVLFTSGSTGVPKGVMQSHANVMHHVRTYTNALHIAADDRLTLLSAFGFDAAVMDIFGALLNGACLCPLELRSEQYPGQLLDRMSADGITILHATPTVFRYLMRSKVCRHELDAVRAVVLGGEEVRGSDFDMFRRQFAPPAVFVNGLGPSESTTAAQYFANHETRLPGGVVPIGNAVADTELLILDAAGQPTGLKGELAIRSAHVAVGYWGAPDLTRDRFMDVGDGINRLYRTGDKVRRLPDGQLAFLGRLDDQIKLRGVRIEPAEIEGVLTALPEVDNAAVILHEDGYSGAARLAAYYSGAADAAALRQALRAALPDYMVPTALLQVDALPLTANGKLDKKRLPEPRWERDAAADFVEPRTETEERVSAIWADVLGVSAVSVHDDFFELGGHSLLAAQVAARMNESLQVVVPLRRLFDAPTVAQISEHIETLQWAMRAAD